MELDIEKINQLKNDFDLAEKEIKKAEFEDNAFPLPPINELRYSYHHFLSALTNNNEDEFRSAEKHIKRAIYDAVDVRLVTYLEAIKAFDIEFKDISISTVIPDWTSKLKEIRKIQKSLANNEDGKTRGQRLENHIEYADAAEEIYDTCNASKDELRKLIDSKAQSTRRFIISTLLALLAIILPITLTIIL